MNDHSGVKGGRRYGGDLADDTRTTDGDGAYGRGDQGANKS